MFYELKYEEEYKKAYFDLLRFRLTKGSMELEDIEDNLDNPKNIMLIHNQMEAINYIFDNSTHDSYGYENKFDFIDLICNIAEKISGGEISDFRTTRAIVNGSSVERSDARFIRLDLYYLIDDYNYQLRNCKTIDDIFEVEANFHIRFLYIHPFEDYNGRISRLLLTYHLCNNSLAPCIITNKDKKEYCNLIENGDAKGLAKLFKRLSMRELDNMITLYNELDSKKLIKSNLMTEKEEEEYKKLRGIK